MSKPLSRSLDSKSSPAGVGARSSLQNFDYQLEV